MPKSESAITTIPTMKTSIVDQPLVRWLKKQGADKRIAYDFYLVKGMGERMELLIVNSSTIEITFYGQEQPNANNKE